MISARCLAVARALRDAGRANGTPPFGMRIGEGGRLVPVPREQRIIAFVVRMRRSGRSYPGIVLACKSRGYKSRAGKPLGLTQVVRIVKVHMPKGEDEQRAA